MLPLRIRDHWNKLDPETQQWLLDNPGCVILPRTIVSAIRQAANLRDEESPHGEVELSMEDLNFLHSQSGQHQ